MFRFPAPKLESASWSRPGILRSLIRSMAKDFDRFDLRQYPRPLRVAK
jgi:hypothetical protein